MPERLTTPAFQKRRLTLFLHRNSQYQQKDGLYISFSTSRQVLFAIIIGLIDNLVKFRRYCVNILHSIDLPQLSDLGIIFAQRRGLLVV